MKRLVLLSGLLVLCLGLAIAAEPGFEARIDFSQGTSGWVPMGSPSLTVSKDEAKVGEQSLFVSGRTQNWESPLFDITNVLTEGGTYKFFVYVKLASGTPTTKGHFTIRSNPAGGGENYTWISDEVDLTDGEWVKIESQDYVFSLKDMLQLALYFETASATAAFYLNDFVIVGDQPITLP